MPMRNDDLDNHEICDPRKIQTLVYFIFTFTFFINSFVIFAFADSLCLWAKLYDRAPTPDNIMFNNGDDRLFLGGRGNTHIFDD